ncbi:DUF934 domain-containing protein [Mameliella alba]|nr:DUF934 domain-containing protein [Antarctobacter heliothermus]MBY6145857.1 DUF934 domain-containing protein [Mameliella alba]MBY6161179.1 DUF934 domain-containing protein [Mameliella alba]MBY6169649.1 DUF934 domain-containing protein [Mameliella alba]MBY6174668.1 DUF934 domain-containing protein [Mameliella alba]
MSIIVRDDGFHAEDWNGDFNGPAAQDLPSDTDPASLAFDDDTGMIRIDFPSFADGRGFTLARLLRLRGYTGRLRAKGHVISDQYAMARRAGFDEVEIDEALAERQPEGEWVFRADWQAHDYQARMRGTA